MQIAKVRTVKTPTRGTPRSAGLDFYVPDDLSMISDKLHGAWPQSFDTISIAPGGSAFIPSGIKANIPDGHALIAFNKSGVALKKSLFIGACVIDEDYQGEIHLHVVNVGNETVSISAGEKLIQLVLVPVSYESVQVVDESLLFAQDSQRGSGGFGSTGDF